MDMFEYKIGTVVRRKYKNTDEFNTYKPGDPLWGHVIGFDQIKFDDGYQTILVVRWDDCEERAIHPSNVTTKGTLE